MKRPLLIESSDDAVPHRIYDLSIEDIKERKEKSIVMPSASDTRNYLGVCRSTFYANRIPGKSLYSAKHNKRFAVRIEKSK